MDGIELGEVLLCKVARRGKNYELANNNRKTTGITGKNKVKLFDKRSGELIDGTWTDEAGNYNFSGLEGPEYRSYIAIGLDKTDQINAAINSRITLILSDPQ